MKILKPLVKSTLAAVICAVPAGMPSASAQSADALVDKLVEKGILTVKEAKDLREEADKGFNQAFQLKTGMPDWVKGWKLNGDLRGRYEGFFRDDPLFTDRHRLRYRLRAGITMDMFDDMEVGVRLTSGEASGAFGGDPISGNTTFQDNGSKKFVYFDLVYAKWAPWNSGDGSMAFTVGKMENPFTFPSTVVFDKDYTPEGLAYELSYRLNSQHKLRLTTAGFMLDELGGTSRDPLMLGAQAHWDAKWADNWSSTLGVGTFNVVNPKSLTTASVPNQGRGNTRDAAGSLVNNYQPIYVDAGVTWKRESFPGFKGAFPITVSGDFLHNPGADRDNQAYSIGLTLGKSGKKGLWDFNYRWTHLQADAWYEEFPESDFGAFYTTAPTGGTAGYQYGANVQGHWFKFSYSPFDCWTLSAAYFLTDLINPSPANSGSSIGRLQIDAVWKF